MVGWRQETGQDSGRGNDALTHGKVTWDSYNLRVTLPASAEGLE